MNSRAGISWKGIILRRREKIKELAFTVEVSKAYSIGKNLEQYQKENEGSKRAEAILETTLSHFRRKQLSSHNANNAKKNFKRSRSKWRRNSRVILKSLSFSAIILQFA